MIVAAKYALGGKAYDSRIEYLEGTGTQYLNTGIRQDNNTVTVKYQQLRYVNDAQIFGVFNWSSSNPRGDFIGHSSTTTLGICQGSRHTTLSMPSPSTYFGEVDHTAVLSRVDGLTLDDTFVGKAPQIDISFTSGYYYYIFRRNGNAPGVTNPAMRLKSFTITSNTTGDVLFDGYPVRVGNIGYFYDSAYGKMIANIGTGSFVLGPDIEE